jgi:hypothetical protein
LPHTSSSSSPPLSTVLARAGCPSYISIPSYRITEASEELKEQLRNVMCKEYVNVDVGGRDAGWIMTFDAEEGIKKAKRVLQLLKVDGWEERMRDDNVSVKFLCVFLFYISLFDHADEIYVTGGRHWSTSFTQVC